MGLTLARHFIIKTSFLCIWSSALWPNAHIIRMISLLKVGTIAITLLLFLPTTTMFSDISSFTKIPTPSNSASFSNHHSLYLCPEVTTKRASWPFHLISCMQHTSTLFFLSSSHTSVFLPQRLAMFTVTNLIPKFSGLRPEILRILHPFKNPWGLGAILFFLIMGIRPLKTRSW